MPGALQDALPPQKRYALHAMGIAVLVKRALPHVSVTGDYTQWRDCVCFTSLCGSMIRLTSNETTSERIIIVFLAFSHQCKDHTGRVVLTH